LGPAVAGEAADAHQGLFRRLSADVTPAAVVRSFRGTRLTALGTLVQISGGRPVPVDLVAAYIAADDPDLVGDAGWAPTLRTAGGSHRGRARDRRRHRGSPPAAGLTVCRTATVMTPLRFTVADDDELERPVDQPVWMV
jgi:hypothetical protein